MANYHDPWPLALARGCLGIRWTIKISVSPCTGRAIVGCNQQSSAKTSSMPSSSQPLTVRAFGGTSDVHNPKSTTVRSSDSQPVGPLVRYWTRDEHYYIPNAGKINALRKPIDSDGRLMRQVQLIPTISPSLDLAGNWLNTITSSCSNCHPSEVVLELTSESQLT